MNDEAVTFWHQVYHQSEESCQDWRRSSMTERFQLLCDAAEVLLRHELLGHLPECQWLSQKAGMSGCTSSHTWIHSCVGRRSFRTKDELYALPVKMPTTMYQSASWLEDWITKLVVADEVSTHIEPRRAMSVLMLESLSRLPTTSSMTEWVAMFQESGLRDDVSIANLQETCLKFVVLARARARELQVDMQVECAQQPLTAKTAAPATKPKSKPAHNTDKQVCRFFLKPDGCKNGDNCPVCASAYKWQALTMVWRHTIFKHAPVLADNSLLGPPALCCTSAKSGDVDFDETAPDQEEHDDQADGPGQMNKRMVRYTLRMPDF